MRVRIINIYLSSSIHVTTWRQDDNYPQATTHHRGIKSTKEVLILSISYQSFRVGIKGCYVYIKMLLLSSAVDGTWPDYSIVLRQKHTQLKVNSGILVWTN